MGGSCFLALMHIHTRLLPFWEMLYFLKRMSFVDISWPWGLVTLGICPLLSGAQLDTRTMMVSGAYILSGLRMGLGGIALAMKGHLRNELPRYEYQRIRWERRGVTSDNKFQFMITMQAE